MAGVGKSVSVCVCVPSPPPFWSSTPVFVSSFGATTSNMGDYSNYFTRIQCTRDVKIPIKLNKLL